MGHIVPCLMEKTSFPNMDAPINKRNLFLLSGRANFPIAEYHRQSPSHQCVKSVQIRSNFWSVFSCIWTECGEIRSISPYSVRTRENTDQKLLRIWTLFTQCDELINLALIWSKFLKDQLLEINSFWTNVPFMQKPGCWFLLAKCLKST